MEKQPTKKYTSKADAIVKLQRYCAYQERSHQEVRSKLIELGIYGHDLEEIIVSLIEENFLNEERFARTPEFRWLKKQAGRFGFQLSYPRNNPHGIAYEPWHWCWRDPGARRYPY